MAGVRRHRRAAARTRAARSGGSATGSSNVVRGQAAAGRAGHRRGRGRAGDADPRARRGGGRAGGGVVAVARARRGAARRGRRDLSRASRDFRRRAERAVRDWQQGVLEMVRTEGADKRGTAKFLAYGVNGLSVALMIVVFAHTAGVTGAEAGIAGGVGRARPEAAGGGLRRPGRAHPRRARPRAISTRRVHRPARRRAAPLHRPRSTALGDRRRGPRPAARRRPPGRGPAVRREPGRTRVPLGPPAHRLDAHCTTAAEGDMTALLEGAKKLVARGSDLGARIEGLDAAADARPRRLDDAVVDEAREVADRASGRIRLSADHTVVAIAGATGSGKSSTFNWLTGLDLSAVGVRRPDHVVGTACVWGSEGADRAARVARHPAAAPGHPRLDARHRREDQSLDGRRPARPARPRLDRGRPPPRGGPAGPARRPAGVGARPAEVRRRGDPRPLPRAVHHPPGRDAGRAQPHRHRARGRTATRWSPTYAACSTRRAQRGAGDRRQCPRGRGHAPSSRPRSSSGWPPRSPPRPGSRPT